MTLAQIKQLIVGVLKKYFGNKKILDGFSEEDGNLLYNGDKIGATVETDSEVTQDSENPVKSSGIYSAIKAAKDDGLKVVPITNENYIKLSDEEKNNDKIIYDVTDKKATQVNGKLENYSTEEQVIGYWIDGKPIYRKVFHFDVAPADNTILLSDIDVMIKQYGSQTYVTGEPFHFPYADGYVTSRFLMNNKNQLFLLRSHTYTNCNWVVEYTKTTD